MALEELIVAWVSQWAPRHDRSSLVGYVAPEVSELEKEGKRQMSLRCKGVFSDNHFPRTYFEGGGHHNAAGGMSTTSMEETVQRFKKAVEEVKNQFH